MPRAPHGDGHPIPCHLTAARRDPLALRWHGHRGSHSQAERERSGSGSGQRGLFLGGGGRWGWGWGANCSALCLRSPTPRCSWAAWYAAGVTSHRQTAARPVPGYPCNGHRFGVSAAANASTTHLLHAALARSSLEAVAAKVAAGLTEAPHKPRRHDHTLARRRRCAGRRVVQVKAARMARSRGCCDDGE